MQPMSRDLAVVCGASGGLGPAVVTALAGSFDVLGVASPRRSPEELRAVAPCEWEQADLEDPGDVERLWQRIDSRGARTGCLVNLTGGFKGGTVAEAEPEAVRQMLRLN